MFATSTASRALFSKAIGKSVLTSTHTSIAVRSISSSVPSTIASAVAPLKGKHFMTIDQLSKDELNGLLDLSHHYKTSYDAGSTAKPLDGKSISMIFQKRSTRTRVSTETGAFLLGAHALFLSPSDIQLGTFSVLCENNG